MPDPILLAIFLGVATLCALEPGPNFVVLADEALRRGRASGWKAAFGMHLGAWPHIFLASAGMMAVLQQLPELLTVLKWAIAGWLVWMAFRTIRGEERLDEDSLGETRGRGAFARGFLLVVLNPRTALFFASFPVLFVSPDTNLATGAQILLFGALTNIIFIAVDMLFVAALVKVRSKVRVGETQRTILRWLGGGLLAGFAAKLMLEKG